MTSIAQSHPKKGSFLSSLKKFFRDRGTTVVKLGLVSFFADIASEMLYPITPIFLTSVLGASMASVGVIEGFAEGVASLLKTYAGAWSDRGWGRGAAPSPRRKPWILAGYALGALAKPLIGCSGSWWQVLGARAIDRTL